MVTSKRAAADEVSRSQLSPELPRTIDDLVRVPLPQLNHWLAHPVPGDLQMFSVGVVTREQRKDLFDPGDASAGVAAALATNLQSFFVIALRFLEASVFFSGVSKLQPCRGIIRIEFQSSEL